jgi:hypothetical protein
MICFSVVASKWDQVRTDPLSPIAERSDSAKDLFGQTSTELSHSAWASFWPYD